MIYSPQHDFTSNMNCCNQQEDRKQWRSLLLQHLVVTILKSTLSGYHLPLNVQIVKTWDALNFELNTDWYSILWKVKQVLQEQNSREYSMENLRNHDLVTVSFQAWFNMSEWEKMTSSVRKSKIDLPYSPHSKSKIKYDINEYWNQMT